MRTVSCFIVVGHITRFFQCVEVAMTLLTKAPAVALVFLCCIAWASAAQPKNAGVKFELRRAETKSAEGLTEATVTGTKSKVYLHKEAPITNKDIARAEPRTDNGNKPAVQIVFTEEGRKKLAKLTEEHQGRPLAVMVNGKVICAPIVRDKISGGQAVVSGNFTMEEAESIAKGIKGQ
jgi:preprotein translocase subunit SecD